MIDDEDPVQLAEYCFNACRMLETITDTDDLDGSVRTGLGGLERCVNRPCNWSCICFPAEQHQGYVRNRADSQERGGYTTHQI